MVEISDDSNMIAPKKYVPKVMVGIEQKEPIYQPKVVESEPETYEETMPLSGGRIAVATKYKDTGYTKSTYITTVDAYNYEKARKEGKYYNPDVNYSVTPKEPERPQGGFVSSTINIIPKAGISSYEPPKTNAVSSYSPTIYGKPVEEVYPTQPISIPQPTERPKEIYKNVIGKVENIDKKFEELTSSSTLNPVKEIYKNVTGKAENILHSERELRKKTIGIDLPSLPELQLDFLRYATTKVATKPASTLLELGETYAMGGGLKIGTIGVRTGLKKIGGVIGKGERLVEPATGIIGIKSIETHISKSENKESAIFDTLIALPIAGAGWKKGGEITSRITTFGLETIEPPIKPEVLSGKERFPTTHAGSFEKLKKEFKNDNDFSGYHTTSEALPKGEVDVIGLPVKELRQKDVPGMYISPIEQGASKAFLRLENGEKKISLFDSFLTSESLNPEINLITGIKDVKRISSGIDVEKSRKFLYSDKPEKGVAYIEPKIEMGGFEGEAQAVLPQGTKLSGVLVQRKTKVNGTYVKVSDRKILDIIGSTSEIKEKTMFDKIFKTKNVYEKSGLNFKPMSGITSSGTTGSKSLISSSITSRPTSITSITTGIKSLISSSITSRPPSITSRPTSITSRPTITPKKRSFKMEPLFKLPKKSKSGKSKQFFEYTGVSKVGDFFGKKRYNKR